MLKARFQKYTLAFKRASGTSRGTLYTKDSWFIFLEDDKNPGVTGIGECGLLKGFSIDDKPGYEAQLVQLCQQANKGYALLPELNAWPSIYFGWEMALADLKHGGQRRFFPSSFTEGLESIPINGLIWMGDEAYMAEQIQKKLEAGFGCIKMKIGAIDFEKEMGLLHHIRNRFPADKMEVRVDANGAFSPKDAYKKLQRLAALQLHSIEQPIRQGNREMMRRLCAATPLPIALDEELTGITDLGEKARLLDTIQPQYIILKPSLVGGFKGTDEWIRLADERGIRWWITSALESNIGLNAIAQYTFSKNNAMYQGLGTGQLFRNNFPSPLEVNKGRLHYNRNQLWDLNLLQP